MALPSLGFGLGFFSCVRALALGRNKGRYWKGVLCIRFDVRVYVVGLSEKEKGEELYGG